MYVSTRCYWDTEDLGVLWDSEGKPIDSAVKYLSRPFPIAVAGSHLDFTFDPKNSHFEASWQVDEKETEEKDVATSLFFLPEHVFGGGLEVRLANGLEWRRSDERRQVIEVASIRPNIGGGTKVWMEVKAVE